MAKKRKTRSDKGKKKTTKKKAPKKRRKTVKKAAPTRRRPVRMAKKKKTRRKRRYTRRKKGPKKQGILSWARGVIATGIGLAPVGLAINNARQSGDFWVGLNRFGTAMTSYYTGLNFDANWNYTGFNWQDLVVGYGAIGGAIAFHKGTGYLNKTVKVNSLIPKLSL
jgi:hypothetical protein